MKNRREFWVKTLTERVPKMEDTQRKLIYEEYLREAEEELPEKVYKLIVKDLLRTKIEKDKDQKESDNTGSNKEIKDKNKEEKDFLSENGRRETIQRVLSVYATMNRTIGYVQGMNYLCSVIYYGISSEENEYTESICFFCFFGLMVEIGDFFSEKMDDSSHGTSGCTKSILEIIEKKDKALYRHLKKEEVLENSSFHLKWVFLLFSGEFPIKDTLVVWDKIFYWKKRKFLLLLCSSVFLLLRKEILKSSFPQILLLLRDFNISHLSLIKKAEKLMGENL
ncbi:TBC1 domain family member 13 [Nematocida sp. LUAm3]|nr:TBC1 domain family member 13 [Nematocida sp. LUAm3]KAI5175997.1 TBC1 domain family member 13 [Nematocida sp. LUAm2]KAI5179093.1 TBC1 domain family member 13 [Nematocida sp. LUAm1]